MLSTSLDNSRTKIFQKWEVPSVRLDRFKPKTDLEVFGQNWKAQQLIRDSQKLTGNITSFLKRKEEYRTASEKSITSMQLHSKYLFEACNRRDGGSQFSLLESRIQNDLQALYLELRTAKRLCVEIKKYFQGVNMPNYDSKTTQVKLVRPAKVVSEELNQQLRMLKDKTKDLQQSLIMKQCKQRVSNFLGKEETLEYRQEELSRSLSLDNVTNIHFLMMYQLEDLRKFIDVLSQANASSQLEYAKYEAVLDSYRLMSRQTVEIDEGSKDLDRIKTVNRAFKEESNRQANEFIAEQNEIETRLSDNIGIYHSNLSNFVRINAEANMLMYFVKRKEYTQKLDELTAKFAYWKRTKAQLTYLIGQQAKFEQAKMEVAIDANKGMKNVTDILYQCQRYIVNDDLAGQYKADLIRYITAYMQSNQQRQIIDFQEVSAELQATIEFFKGLALLKPHQKTQYVSSHYKTLPVLHKQCQKYLNSSQNKSSVHLCQGYEAGLNYCAIISCNRQTQSTLLLMHPIRRYQSLPTGFSDYLFNYINDIVIFEAGRETDEKLKISFEQVKIDFRSKSIDKIDEQIEKILQYHPISMVYPHYISNISDFSPELVQQSESLSWIRTIKAIAQVVQVTKNYDGILFQKQQFFSFSVLGSLLSKQCAKPMPQKDLNLLLEYIFARIEDNCRDWSHQQLRVQILKLLMLKQYLMQDIWTLHFDTHNHVATVDSIIRLCKAHYYFALVEQMFEKSRDPRQARSCWALFIKLQMSLDQINISYNDSPSRQTLQRMTAAVVKELKKGRLQITLTSGIGSNSLSRLDLVRKALLIDQNVSKLKVLQRQNSQLSCLGNIYVLTAQLIAASDLRNAKFQSYENMYVRNLSSRKFSFEEYRLEQVERYLRQKHKNQAYNEIMQFYSSMDTFTNLQMALGKALT